MSCRSLAAVFALVGLAGFTGLPDSAAREPDAKLAPERQLIGAWHGAGGDWSLRLNPDKTAVMQVGLTINHGKDIDWRRGTFSVLRGAWVVTVRDIDKHEFVYSVVSHNPDQLSLIDVGGHYIEFSRTRDLTLQLLQGRWLGPGADYTLVLNGDRSATLEIGVSKGFGQFSEVRTGTFTLRDGFWTLKVQTVNVAKNAEAREYTYAIISHNANEFSLLDVKGNLLRFHRVL
jgi:hypothetical protein